MTLYRNHHIAALRSGHRWLAYAIGEFVGVVRSEAEAMMIARRHVDDHLWRQLQSSMDRVIPLRQPRGHPDWTPRVIDCERLERMRTSGIGGTADEYGEEW